MILKGFSCTEEEASIWSLEQLKKYKCALQEDIFCKGNFKDMMWIKFNTASDRDDAIKKCAKSSFKMDGTKIWTEKDLPYDVRQMISLLLALRKEFITNGLLKEGMYMDKSNFSLYYYQDLVMTLELLDNQVQCHMNSEWIHYIAKTNFEEIKLVCNTRLMKGSVKDKQKPK